MKYLFLFFLAASVAAVAAAKSVKFAVDMTGQTISANGVHVMGDFQTAAGYSGGNWQAATTSLVKEGATQIYSVVVNIPAFNKYEYKFVNGDQTYDVEFVPEESRVGGSDNIDNRWIYVDSLANDTLVIGSLPFAGNAPSGKYLLRFKVDMRNNLPAASTGAHVAGSFQGLDPARTRLYSFQDSVYEYIAYVTAGSYTYRYYSGNTAASTETVPSGCASSGYRSIAVGADVVLSTVCFSSCAACVSTAVVNTTSRSGDVLLYPNPATGFADLVFNDNDVYDIRIADVAGRVVGHYPAYKESKLRITTGELGSGLYFINARGDKGTAYAFKLMLQ